LCLDGTKVTDAGVKELGCFQGLVMLSLGSTAITTASLRELKQLKNIRYLMLDHTDIDDSALPELKGLSELKCLIDLTLSGTKITAAGFSELSQALPRVHIDGNHVEAKLNSNAPEVD
jgi:hypothetical protein